MSAVLICVKQVGAIVGRGAVGFPVGRRTLLPTEEEMSLRWMTSHSSKQGCWDTQWLPVKGGAPGRGRNIQAFPVSPITPSSLLLYAPTSESCWQPQSVQGSASGGHIGTWGGGQTRTRTVSMSRLSSKNTCSHTLLSHLPGLWLNSKLLNCSVPQFPPS